MLDLKLFLACAQADGTLGTLSSLGAITCDASYEACTGTPTVAIADASCDDTQACTCQEFTANNPGADCPAGCAVPTAECLVPNAAFTFSGCLENSWCAGLRLPACANDQPSVAGVALLGS